MLTTVLVTTSATNLPHSRFQPLEILCRSGASLLRRPRSHILFGHGIERPGFGLEKDRTRRQADDRMPDPGRQIGTSVLFPWSEGIDALNIPSVIEQDQGEAATDANEAFRFGIGQMAVRADIGARFHGIEEPLAGLVVTGMEIQVLPPPGIGGSFPGKSRQ